MHPDPNQQLLKSVQGTAIPASLHGLMHVMISVPPSATSLRRAAAIVRAGTALLGRLTWLQRVRRPRSAQTPYCSILSHT